MQRLYAKDKTLIGEDCNLLDACQSELQKLAEQTKISQFRIKNNQNDYTFLKNLANLNLLLNQGYSYENTDFDFLSSLICFHNFYYQGELKRTQMWGFNGSDKSLSYGNSFMDKQYEFGFYLSNNKMVGSYGYDSFQKVPLYLFHLARPILLNYCLENPSFGTIIAELKTEAELKQIMWNYFGAFAFTSEEERVTAKQHCLCEFHR